MAKLDYSVEVISKEENVMATLVTGEMYHDIDGQLAEIKRQLRQPNGYPFNPDLLKIALQNAIEGRFGNDRAPSFLEVIATTSLEADACIISTLGSTKDLSFAEIAAKVLGVGVNSSIRFLGTALIENGHTMTQAQAEEMVERTERGEKTRMRTDGYEKFFFVETGNPENPVRIDSVSRLGLGGGSLKLGHTCRVFYRLFVRNLDTSKL